MIKDIRIRNFRCFNDLSVSGFEKINLISGKNNIGKTALLEAIFLNSDPSTSTISLLRQGRRENPIFRRELPERTWNNFFFQQDKSNEISIKSKLENGSSQVVEICVNESESAKDFSEDIYQQENEGEEGKYIESIMRLKVTIGMAEPVEISISSNERIQDSMIRNSRNSNAIKTSFNIKKVLFVRSSLRVSSRTLTSEFDKARLNEKDNEILKAFQAIDPSIIAIESFSIGEPTIYLRREGETRLPLSLFGDAVNRIADIILRIVNNENSILLIDEIENGIHHSSQVYFWQILYDLANKLNIQIFATTHSLEMTQAFIEAGMDQQNLAAHFELTKHAKTGKIVAIRRDLETLDYGISHNKKVRG